MVIFAAKISPEEKHTGNKTGAAYSRFERQFPQISHELRRIKHFAVKYLILINEEIWPKIVESRRSKWFISKPVSQPEPNDTV